MRALVFLYGLLSYFLFFGAFVYLIAFVGDIYAPKTLSSKAVMDMGQALQIDIGLLLLWAVQHSFMARDGFKKAIEKMVPHHVERSTYVLVSTLVLAILMFYWQPIDGVIWQVETALYQMVIWGLFAFGWVLVLVSTFLTNHFDLFGLRQTWLHFVKKTYTDIRFTERLIYKWIRHPMMLGILIAFWAVPTMTMGHLVFSIGMSLYVVVGIYFEERAMVKTIGEPYEEYQKRTSKILPKIY